MERFVPYAAKLVGDSAYGSAEMLGWLLYEHRIELARKSTRRS